MARLPSDAGTSLAVMAGGSPLLFTKGCFNEKQSNPSCRQPYDPAGVRRGLRAGSQHSDGGRRGSLPATFRLQMAQSDQSAAGGRTAFHGKSWCGDAFPELLTTSGCERLARQGPQGVPQQMQAQRRPLSRNARAGSLGDRSARGGPPQYVGELNGFPGEESTWRQHVAAADYALFTGFHWPFCPIEPILRSVSERRSSLTTGCPAMGERT